MSSLSNAAPAFPSSFHSHTVDASGFPAPTVAPSAAVACAGVSNAHGSGGAATSGPAKANMKQANQAAMVRCLIQRLHHLLSESPVVVGSRESRGSNDEHERLVKPQVGVASS